MIWVALLLWANSAAPQQVQRGEALFAEKCTQMPRAQGARHGAGPRFFRDVKTACAGHRDGDSIHRNRICAGPAATKTPREAGGNKTDPA